MKGKLIVSLGAAVGLQVLSIIACISAEGDLMKGVSASQGMAYEIAMEKPVILLEPVPLPVDLPVEKTSKSPNLLMECQEGQRDGEEYLLAKLAMAEAEGEDKEGKALVMMVVLNRVRDTRFPDTVEEVIYQTKQFSSVANGRFDAVEPDADCWEAFSMVQHGWDGSKGATYFHSERKSSWHERNLCFLFKHGAHYFYTDGEAFSCE